MIEPKEQAKQIVDLYREYVKDLVSKEYELTYSRKEETTNSKECAKIDINGKLDLLRELNEVKLCQFNKEIEYWEEVLKEVDSL